jgi:hypothetical protein
MSERAAYSRVYWSIVDDPKFVTIYDHDSHLAAWLRLLLIADQAHPASAHLPANVRKASVAALADVELIDLLPGGRYRIHGLDEERRRRREAATSRPGTTRPPNGPRPGTERSPTGIQTPGLRRAEVETRQDEPRHRAPDDPFDAPEMPALQWLVAHKVVLQPHDGYYRHLVMAVERHGVEAVVQVFDELHGAGMPDGDTKGYVFGARDELDRRKRPNLRAVEKAEDRAADSERRAGRFEATKARAHEIGYHADEPDPGCPKCREGAA